MSKRATRLKAYVTNILNSNDIKMEFIYLSNEDFMWEGNACKVEDMNFTVDTLHSSLQIIADHTFTPGEVYKPYHVVALFLYCKKIDEYFRKSHDNYNSDVLVDALVNILIKIDYNVPRSYCSIL